jgi:hypothetical protein
VSGVGAIRMPSGCRDSSLMTVFQKYELRTVFTTLCGVRESKETDGKRKKEYYSHMY